MQKYAGGKQTAATMLPKIEIIEIKIGKTLEENLTEDKHKTQKLRTEDDKETKLEKAAKSVEKLVEKDTLKTITEENRENKFITYTAKNSTAEAYNSTDEFYDSESTNYYDNLMQEEKKTSSEFKPEYHEQKKEERAEQSQYIARESNEFGAQLTREGVPTREEQTTFGASSVAAEEMWLFKMLNPGWWKCLYDLKAIAPVF